MSSSILVHMFWPPLLLDLLLLPLLPPPPPPSLLLLLLLLCRYSLLRAFQKTQNENQSVETGCAPRCIAGREAAAAQQQHSSSTAAAQQQQRRRRRRRRWRWLGSSSGQLPFGASGCCCVVPPLPSVCVLILCVCTSGCPSFPWLRGFGPGIKLGACRPIVWTADSRMNLERSSVQMFAHLGSSGPFFVKFVQFLRPFISSEFEL